MGFARFYPIYEELEISCDLFKTEVYLTPV